MKFEKLSSICKISNGFAFKSDDYAGQGYRVMRITNVQKGCVVDDDPKFIPQEIADKVSNFKLKTGDILVSLTGNVGRVGRIFTKHLPAVLNQRVGLIRTSSPKLDDKYLFQILNSDKFEREAIQNSNGVAQLNLSSKWIENYEIPLPPLVDQKRIAYLLGKVEGLIAQRKQHLQHLDDLLKSMFQKMFGDPMKNEKEWNTSPIEGHCSLIVDCPHSTPEYSEEKTGYYCVRSSDIVDGYLTLSETYQVSRAIFNDRIERYSPQPKDVIYSREGGRLGNAARIIGQEKICLGQRMMLFKSSNSTTPEFLWALLESIPFKAKLQSLIGGGAAPRVNIKDVKKVIVINPPHELQLLFSKFVLSLDVLREHYKQNLNQLEDLYGVLSQKAFKGEIDLSRVPILEIQVEEDKTMAAEPSQTPHRQDFSIRFPATDNLLDGLENPDSRKVIISKWLEAYCSQMGRKLFTAQSFMEVVRTHLSELHPDNDFELGTDDYETIKAWVFEALATGRLKQSRNITGHDEKGETIFGNLIELQVIQA